MDDTTHNNPITRISMRVILATVLTYTFICSCEQEAEKADPPPDEPSALIITSDYETGAYSVIRLSDLKVWKNIQVIHSDAVCRYDAITGQPFIVARLGADAIEVIDPEQGWQIVKEYSVGVGTNPQDISMVSAKRAYVARFNTATLLLVDPTHGKALDTIDLSEYADEDGLPEPTWLYELNGKTYVLLSRLKGMQPSDQSLMLVLDSQTGQVEESVELSTTNPAGKLRYHEGLRLFVIIESGNFSSVNGGEPDGGIEFFDPADNRLSGLFITEKTLGGDIVDAVLVSKHKGYALVGIPQKSGGNKTALVSINPSSGKVLKRLKTWNRWSSLNIELTPDRTELWVTDRTFENPGIRIFDVETDEERTRQPIDVGLQPFMICFVP